MNDFNERLLKLAQEQDRVASRVKVAQQMRDHFYEQYVKPYEDEIVRLQASVANDEQALKADFLAYVQETGDLKPHPALTFRRDTKLVYDKNATLERAKEEAPELVRIKEELDVRAFEKAWRNNAANWAEVEVVNTPTAVLGKLGDLLITQSIERPLT